MMTRRRFSNLMDALVGRFSEKDFRQMNEEEQERYSIVWTSWYQIDNNPEDDYLNHRPEIIVALDRAGLIDGGTICEIDEDGHVLFEKYYDNLDEMFKKFMTMID